MLEEISISNLGIIKNASLSFGAGLTVITGETGAGKTMVLSALHLLLGRRSSASMVGRNATALSVEGCWNTKGLQVVPLIEETGAIIEDNQVFINRTVDETGKSRAVIGGKTTPASILSDIGAQLVNIHGQSDQMRLKSATEQRNALDTYAGAEFYTQLQAHKTAYSNHKRKLQQVETLKRTATQRKEAQAHLIRLIEEFEEVAPISHEDEELAKEISTLSNIDAIRSGLAEAVSYIAPDVDEVPTVSEQLSSAVRALDRIVMHDETISEISQRIASAADDLDEALGDLESYSDNLDEDSLARLYHIEERSHLLKKFLKRWNYESAAVAVDSYEAAVAELSQLQEDDQPVSVIEDELRVLLKVVQDSAAAVTRLRVLAAGELSAAVNVELAGLAMGSNRLSVVVGDERLSASGKDSVEFMLSSGGQGARPIAKAASGGELSRIMLALEVVLADPEVTPTFVFDEVDSGVGGVTAIEIGKRLSKLSIDAQVIVVTHLPQVAAYADTHLVVVKDVDSDNYTETSVMKLDEIQKINEVTRMLSGMVNDSGKAHAADLMEHARLYKRGLYV